MPVMPGVLVDRGDGADRRRALRGEPGAQARPTRVLLMTIDKAKFRKPVVPGDQLRLHMTKINKRRNIWWFRGEAKVDGVLVCEAEVSAMLVAA